MRVRGIVLSLLAAVVLLPSGAAEAEPVVVGAEGVATRHADGMPAATEPWRILVRGALTTDSTADTWAGTAVLGGPVPAGQSLNVSWIPGIQHPQGCEPLIQFTETVTTLDAGNAVTVERPLPEGYLTQTPSCLRITVYSAGASSDELVGEMVPLTRLAGAQAQPVAPLRVAVGRTTPVLLMVTSHARPTNSVAISGTGPGVRMKDVTTGPLATDQSRPVVAKVSAPGIADSELALTARDDLGSDSFDQSWKIRAREMKAQRPLPGRYRSTDGTVRFRVTDDHRVVRLRTSAVNCEGSDTTRATYPVEIRMPRSGATAKVTQLGSRWLGAQLLTRAPGRVQGSFLFSTSSCWMSQLFVARRQG